MVTAFSAEWLRGSSFYITYLGNGLIWEAGQGDSQGAFGGGATGPLFSPVTLLQMRS